MVSNKNVFSGFEHTEEHFHIASDEKKIADWDESFAKSIKERRKWENDFPSFSTDFP